MAIKITAALHPYGFSADPLALATIKVWTTDDVTRHAYSIHLEGRTDSLYGVVPKDASGHRNILDLLRAVTDNALEKYGDELGADYVTTKVDK